MGARLSVVIPVRNDASALARTLDHLVRVAPGVEVVVAACGDPDGTAQAVAGRARVCWPGGSTRAQLMNAGAAAATGDVFFFLHADSLPPAHAAALIERAVEPAGVAGGAFEHQFDERGFSLAAVNAVNRVRYRLTRNYYGDQGIFVRREVFHRLGGFKDVALMEDLDFSQRLKRAGRVVLIRAPLRTSARRFIARGPWRTLAFIAWLLLLHTLGCDTQRYAERWRGPADRSPGSRPSRG